MNESLELLRENGQTDLVQDIEYKIDTAREMGKSMGQHLQEILNKLEFDPGLIATNGAISFDIYFGNEIEAINRFHPKKFIVSEDPQPTEWERRANGDIASYKDLVIQTLGKGINFEYVDKSLKGAISTLENSGTHDYGLVTWLNIWPVGVDSEVITDFIIKTSKFLASNGLILISDQGDPSGRVKKIVADLSNRGIQGYKIEGFTSLMNNRGGGAGEHFLAVRKTSAE